MVNPSRAGSDLAVSRNGGSVSAARGDFWKGPVNRQAKPETKVGDRQDRYDVVGSAWAWIWISWIWSDGSEGRYGGEKTKSKKRSWSGGSWQEEPWLSPFPIQSLGLVSYSSRNADIIRIFYSCTASRKEDEELIATPGERVISRWIYSLGILHTAII